MGWRREESGSSGPEDDLFRITLATFRVSSVNNGECVQGSHDHHTRQRRPIIQQRFPNSRAWSRGQCHSHLTSLHVPHCTALHCTSLHFHTHSKTHFHLSSACRVPHPERQANPLLNFFTQAGIPTTLNQPTAQPASKHALMRPPGLKRASPLHATALVAPEHGKTQLALQLKQQPVLSLHACLAVGIYC